jgi:hypothetical protein
MGGTRSGQICPRRSPRWSGGQTGAQEPALERSLRGDGPTRRLQQELHSDQAGTPSGVFSAEPHSGLHRLGGHGLGGREVPVMRWDAVATAAPKPLEETAHGGARQIQRRGDLASATALLPEPEHRLTDRDWNGTRHGQPPQKQYHETNYPRLYRCRPRDQTGCRDFPDQT